MRNPLSPDGHRKAVIGIGNPMRGEDAFGVLVAQQVDRFASRVAEPCSLLEALEGLDAAAIVDAAWGRPHGVIEEWEVGEALRAAQLELASTHILGLDDALRLAQALHRLPASVKILTVGIAQTGLGEPPSQAVLDAVRPAAEKAQRLLAAVG